MQSIMARIRRPVDPVTQQLASLSHQGAGMARIAHACATLLVVLFSAGSLVALGSDALRTVLRDWTVSHQLDIPSTITVCVSTLMVLAMDCAMLQAASMLRLLSSRRADLRERGLHIAVMATVAALESGTYWYMSATYERPATAAAGALIIARALAAPLLAVYLSMSRVLPITSRDILAQAELASGAGLLRDVTLASNDAGAPLHRKMQLYSAVAIMTPADRTRLDSMIGAVLQESPTLAGHTIPAMLTEASDSPPTALLEAPGSLDSLDPDPRPPTGPGSPSARTVRTAPSKTVKPGTIKLVPEKQPRKIAARARHPKESVEAKVRAAYAPGMSVGDLERAAGVSRSSANRWRIVLEREQASAAQ